MCFQSNRRRGNFPFHKPPGSRRAVARDDNWGGGGVYIHIFMFTYSTVKTIDFKRNPLGRTRIYEYTPPNYRSSYGPGLTYR